MIQKRADEIFSERVDEWNQYLEENPELSDDEISKIRKNFYDECLERAEYELSLDNDEGYINVDYEQVKADYNKDYFDDDEIKQIKKKAIEDIKKSFKYNFITHCTNFSYLNDTALECLNHVLISVITKDMKIYIDKNKIFPKIHMHWMQDSGSGKGEAFNEFGRIIKEYNKLTDKPLKFKKKSGADSTESYLNNYERIGNKYLLNKPPTIGAFQESDVMCMEESSFIFAEKRGQKQTLAEHLLDALENKPIPKKLVGWNNQELLTYPNFALIGSSRPTGEIQENIAVSGLIQRMIPYHRVIDQETSRMMRQMDIKNKMFPTHTEEEFEKEREKIARELQEIREFVQQNKVFTYEEKDECFNLLCKIIDEMEMSIYDILSKQEYQIIAKSFVSRFVNQILVIAVHNAMMRFSMTVNTEDILNATNLFKKLFKQLCLWIEQNIDESRLLRKRRRLFKGFLKEWFEDKLVYTKEEFASMISKRTGYSKNYGYELIKTYSIGETALLNVQDGVVTLNKFGDKNG